MIMFDKTTVLPGLPQFVVHSDKKTAVRDLLLV